MKIFKLSATALSVAITIGVLPAAIGSATQRVGQYDFTYFTSGEMRATPVQVFDDGKSTYFQFRAGEAIPAIFQLKEGKPELLVPSFEGPFVRVTEVSGRYTLQLGRSQAQVVYGGQGRDSGMAISAVNTNNGMKTAYNGNGYPSNPSVKLVASLTSGLDSLKNDSMESNSYATPVKGDRVTWRDSETRAEAFQIWFEKGKYILTKKAAEQILANKAVYKAATSITVIGRDDDSYKEGLELERAKVLKEALVKLGVEASRILVKTGVSTPPDSGRWASDIRVETVMPTQVARPEPKNDRCSVVKSNLEGLIRAGAMNQDQAVAILRQRCGAAADDNMANARDAAKEQAAKDAALKEAAAKDAAAKAAELSKNLEVPPGGFDFKSTDRLMSNTVKRWAAATNYQVIWDAPPSSDAPINGDAVIASASMKEALERVISAMNQKGYDLQATVYSNRVIRFTRSNAK